ncbi:MAG TPA: flagellar basal body L-ring protein FlgH [Candidatus Methylomirabilis sp.]|nr:flagellar basal body L-ring protein FlgH [Candidatus Methylomirabilis sp.]HSC72083.1 flagellar basal body L-ring protein FlgH [Candidatus Methylomirabilis sp.]
MRRIAAVVIGGLALLQAATGSADSLWKDGGGGSLFTDVRASRLGDVVTVLVMEAASSDRKAETNLKKDSENNFDLATFFGNTHFGAGRGGNRAKFAFTGNNEQEANGNITRSDRVTAQIPARVMKVLDGGLLLIEGRRAIVVNDETQTLAFSGVVRPADIGPDNSVRSTLVADAEITMVGKGILEEKQRPGILQRLFDIFRIF